MARSMWLVMVMIFVGCGGEEGQDDGCAQPGVYTCVYTLKDTDCPAGMIKSQITGNIATDHEECGMKVGTSHQVIDGCDIECSIEMYFGEIVVGSGGCNVTRCVASNFCNYTVDVVCRHGI
jgi:hypothetical protein